MGRVVGQPRLAARPAPVLARRRRERRRRRATHDPADAAARPTASRCWRRRPRRASPSSGRRSACRPAGADPAGRCRLLAAAVRPRRSTDVGGGRPTATSPPAPTRPGWRASREEPVVSDEPDGGGAARPRDAGAPDEPALAAAPSLLADDARGAAQVGTLVHRVLEATDFAAADLDAELARRRSRRSSPGGGSRSATRPWWRPDSARRSRRRSARWPEASACATSTRTDRLDELDFELPLAGGDEPSGRVTLGGDRATPARAPRRPRTRWPATPSGSATRPCGADVRGYLTGSLDLVVRLRGPADRAVRGGRLQDELARRARRAS